MARTFVRSSPLCRLSGAPKFGVGFAAGYGLREWKSRKRHRHYTYLRETADEAPDVTFLHPEREKGGRHWPPSQLVWLAHQLRQLRHVRRDPPRLVFGEQVLMTGAASFSFPSAARSDGTHWPASGTARVFQAKRPSELIRCIRRQTGGRALTVRNPQIRSRRFFPAFLRHRRYKNSRRI
jgi:hypothetical protein